MESSAVNDDVYSREPMTFFDRTDFSEHWSLRLGRTLFASWFLLVPCLVFPFVRGWTRLEDQFSGFAALISLAVFFYGSLLWLMLFLVDVAKRRGKIGLYLWLQACALVALEVLAGSVISHP